MKQELALVTGAVTLVGMWMAGSHKWQGWLLGLLNQGLWLAFIITFKAWGLLPLNICLVFVYGRNLWRWRHAHIVEVVE